MDKMELQRGQRVVNTFRGIKGSENPFLNREAIILGRDWEGSDYYAFYPNCALGWEPTDEDYEVLEELGVDEFGTMGYIFSSFYQEA